MATKRVRATSASSARKKAKTKNTVITKVNYIKGSRKGKTGTYAITTKKKKKVKKK